MDKSRIEELTAKARLTADEKEEIRKAADSAGIAYTIKGNCRSCYEKVLLALWEHEPDNAAPVVSADGWVLRKPSDSFEHRGKVYNAATVPSIEVGGLHPSVLSHYFSKPKNGAGEAKSKEAE